MPRAPHLVKRESWRVSRLEDTCSIEHSRETRTKRREKRGLAYPLLQSALCRTPCALRIRPTLPPWCDIRGHSFGRSRFFSRHDVPNADTLEIPAFSPPSPLTDFAVTRIFMTVRHEIAEARRETGARSPEAPTRTRAVRGGSEGRARRPKAVSYTHLDVYKRQV